MLKINRLNIIDSTNSEAERMLANKTCTPPFVIISNYQTKGKGQGDHMWESAENKNLTFSWVVTPNILSEQQVVLTALVSTSIKETIGQLINNPDIVKIKWINDVYVNDNKIAGILISNKVCDNKIVDSIIGIGININQTTFPPSLTNPTSLRLITGNEYSINDVFNKLMNSLIHNYDTIYNNPQSLIDKYAHNLYKLGEPFEYTVNGKKEVRIIKGIDNTGNMIW